MLESGDDYRLGSITLADWAIRHFTPSTVEYWLEHHDTAGLAPGRP